MKLLGRKRKSPKGRACIPLLRSISNVSTVPSKRRSPDHNTPILLASLAQVHAGYLNVFFLHSFPCYLPVGYRAHTITIEQKHLHSISASENYMLRLEKQRTWKATNGTSHQIPDGLRRSSRGMKHRRVPTSNRSMKSSMPALSPVRHFDFVAIFEA